MPWREKLSVGRALLRLRLFSDISQEDQLGANPSLPGASGACSAFCVPHALPSVVSCNGRTNPMLKRPLPRRSLFGVSAFHAAALMRLPRDAFFRAASAISLEMGGLLVGSHKNTAYAPGLNQGAARPTETLQGAYVQTLRGLESSYIPRWT